MSPRGAGYTFGQDITEQFNHANGLKMIARGAPARDGGVPLASRPGVGDHLQRPQLLLSVKPGGNHEVSDDMTTEFLQFDPAPRRGEEQSTKRCPDYFL